VLAGDAARGAMDDEGSALQWQLSDAEARGDADALTRRLRRHASEPCVQQQVAAALVRLLQAGGAATARTCVQARVLVAVYTAQRAHRAHAGLQLECVRLLSELQAHSHLDPQSDKTANARPIDGAVTALRVHGCAYAELAAEACCLIIALTTFVFHVKKKNKSSWRVCPRAVAEVMRDGAVPAVLAVLAAHSEHDNAAAMAHVHDLLAWLTSSDCATVACREGAIHQLAAALHAHCQPQPLAAACHTLATLISPASDRHVSAAADAGAVEALCDVVADCPRFPDVQAHACAALSWLLRRLAWRADAHVLYQSACNAGALRAARAALARHPAHGALQANADALVLLLERHDAAADGDGDDDARGSDDVGVAADEAAASAPQPASAVAVEPPFSFMRAAALGDDAEAAESAAAEAADAPRAYDNEPSSAHWSVCVLCRREPRCLLMLPCRHLALCGARSCADRLGFPPCRTCPLCRVSLDDTLLVFPL
jgi:hypothetical protein